MRHLPVLQSELENPYLDIVRSLRNAAKDTILLYDYAMYRNREDLVKRFAWAIPTDKVIYEIAKYSPIVEIGAGTGYWAWLIEQAGGTVVCYDSGCCMSDGKSCYCDDVRYHPVAFGTATSVVDHPDHTLMLCWPPYADPMAWDCLSLYKGNRLIYIGEGDGGCTGDDEFHKLLWEEWTEIKYLQCPQWPGIHDSVRIYERV